MGKPGPDRKVSDFRLLLEIYLGRQGGKFATQVQDNISLSTVQGTRDRLNELVKDNGHVTVEDVGGRNLYQLTDDGEEYLMTELRDRID
jgi:predicted transcriptional regulator